MDVRGARCLAGWLLCLADAAAERARPERRSDAGATVRASFLHSDRTYGARRVWRDLLADGIVCGLHRIERLMRLQALRARPRRRRLPPDTGERLHPRVAPNVLDRQFRAPAPNRKWVADFTYIWTAEGWLYVAVVLDLFSRRVVGWSMSAAMTAQLVTDALMMAIWRRGKPRRAAASLRSRQPVHQRAVPAADGRARRRLLDEPLRQRLGQRGDGELLLVAQDRAHGAQDLPHPGRGQGRCVRLHRALLQSAATALDDRLSQPD